MPLRKRHFSVILQMEPLDAAPHQIFPAWFHGCTQETGVQGRYLTYKNKSHIPVAKNYFNLWLTAFKAKQLATLPRNTTESSFFLSLQK